jgi:heme exporter protein A
LSTTTVTQATPETAVTRGPALLQAQGVTCQRGGRRLLVNFQLTLHPGRLVWLRGDNGRGKTSLLRV